MSWKNESQFARIDTALSNQRRIPPTLSSKLVPPSAIARDPRIESRARADAARPELEVDGALLAYRHALGLEALGEHGGLHRSHHVLALGGRLHAQSAFGFAVIVRRPVMQYTFAMPFDLMPLAPLGFVTSSQSSNQMKGTMATTWASSCALA